MIPVRQGVSLFVMRDDGKLLAIARRDNPNSWGLVGGKVDPGETLEAAIERESFEEAGLIISSCTPIFTSFVPSRSRAGVSYLNTTFIADVKNDPSPQVGEPRLAWVQPQTLIYMTSYRSYNERLFVHLGLDSRPPFASGYIDVALMQDSIEEIINNRVER